MYVVLSDHWCVLRYADHVTLAAADTWIVPVQQQAWGEFFSPLHHYDILSVVLTRQSTTPIGWKEAFFPKFHIAEKNQCVMSRASMQVWLLYCLDKFLLFEEDRNFNSGCTSAWNIESVLSWCELYFSDRSQVTYKVLQRHHASKLTALRESSLSDILCCSSPNSITYCSLWSTVCKSFIFSVCEPYMILLMFCRQRIGRWSSIYWTSKEFYGNTMWTWTQPYLLTLNCTKVLIVTTRRVKSPKIGEHLLNVLQTTRDLW